MNVALPLIVSAVLLSILGMYGAVTDSEYAMTQRSLGAIEQLAERRGEILDGTVSDGQITLESHSAEESRIFLIDFILHDGKRKRVIYSDQDTFDDATPALEIRKSPRDAPQISPGTRETVSLHGMGIDPGEVSSASVLTYNGNRFPIDWDVQGGNGTSRNGTSGQSTIDGMGINARIIQVDFEESRVMHGSNLAGTYQSIKPYVTVSHDTDFAALVRESEGRIVLPIPEFSKSYVYHADSLDERIIERSTVLRPERTSALNQGITYGYDGSAVTLSGTGSIFVKPHALTDENLVMDATLENAQLRIVSSPLDLTSLIKDEEGYVIYQDTAPRRETVSDGIWSIVSYPDLLVPDGTELYGSYNMSLECLGSARYSECHQYPKFPPLQPHPKCIGSHCRTEHRHLFSDSGESVITTSDAGRQMSVSKMTTDGNKKFSYDRIRGSYNHTLYAPTPWHEEYHFAESFERQISLPADSYIMVSLNSGTAVIEGKSASHDVETHFLRVEGLVPHVPYQIAKNGSVIAGGMTDESGRIIIDDTLHVTDGLLYLYPDSLVYRGSWDGLAMDILNGGILRMPAIQDTIYVTHAYAAIPVTGDIMVTHVSLDGIMQIKYLEGSYSDGDTIHVPVVPGYHTIRLEINGVNASLAYGNILGGTGITIAEPESSTIRKSASGPIHHAEAVAGTVAYAIAASDGTLKAAVSETISGTVHIQNTYQLEKNPPPPPPLRRADPLSGWVDIHLNGKLVEQRQLGVNPYPDFDQESFRDGSKIVQSVTYSYPDYTLSAAISVPVKAGDLVEFFVYARIYGEIGRYDPPQGYHVRSSAGQSAATATIGSAYITTDGN